MSLSFNAAWRVVKEMRLPPRSLRVSPEQAMSICRDGGCVWIKDYSDFNYGTEDEPHYDYPVEDPDELQYIINYNELPPRGPPLEIVADDYR